MRRLLTVFTLFAGLFLILVGGQYLLSLYGLIEVPTSGWFNEGLLDLEASTTYSQIVAWEIAIFGLVLMVIGTYYLFKR